MFKKAAQSTYYKQNKKNRSDYKKAIDLGKRSGGGRIITTFYDYARRCGQDPSDYKFILWIWFINLIQRIAL